MEKQKWRKYIPCVIFVPVIAITVVLFLYRDAVAEFGNWGYLGAFLIGLVANATVIMPMPGLLLLFALGATFNPVLVGLAGGAGGALGEMSGYIVGYGGHAYVKNIKLYIRAEGWMTRWGSMAIFTFALAPFLPLDIAGIAAGTLRFPVWKFLLACLFGKALLYTGMTLATAWGWQTVQSWLA